MLPEPARPLARETSLESPRRLTFPCLPWGRAGKEATCPSDKGERTPPHGLATDPFRGPAPTPTRKRQAGWRACGIPGGKDGTGGGRVGDPLLGKGGGVPWKRGEEPKALEPRASFAPISVPTLSSPPLSVTRGRTPSLTAPHTMTIGHIPRHSLDTSNLLHTWSLDTGWYTGVIMSHGHTMASLRKDTLRPPHSCRIPAPLLHTRRCTYTHAPGHTWPHRQVRSAPHFSRLLPNRGNRAAPGRGCSV